jgi:hypothetical protein
MVGVVGDDYARRSARGGCVEAEVLGLLTMPGAGSVDGLPGVAVSKGELVGSDADNITVFLV